MVIPNWLRFYLRAEELQPLAEKIGEFEKRTSAEIVTMVVKSSSQSRTAGWIIWITFTGIFLLADHSVHYSSWDRTQEVVFFSGIIVASLFLSFLLSQLHFVQRVFTPSFELSHNVHLRAELEFYRNGLNETRGHTGILIFLSMMERRVVVLADKSIASQLPESTWNDVTQVLITHLKKKSLAQGFTEAVSLVADKVSKVFPPQAGDTDELSNNLIIKE